MNKDKPVIVAELHEAIEDTGDAFRNNYAPPNLVGLLERSADTIEALCEALDRLLVNIDTSISSGAVVDSWHEGNRALALARGEQP